MVVEDAAARVGTSIGQYTIVRELGTGGMGIVYEAVHSVIGQRAAIKMISVKGARDPDYLARFESEARAAAAVQHPGLVKVFDFGSAPDGAPYLMMEFVEGETLRARLSRGRLPLDCACKIARQIAAALAAIHTQGIVHRDLKPENVMIVQDDAAEGGERIKLLDFGVARRVAGEPFSTGPNVILGTPPYMSPEQCSAGKVDVATDVYALGVLLHEMILGSPPFVGDSAQVMRSHVIEPVRVPEEGLPDNVRELLLRMLAKEPSARPTSWAVEDELRRTSSRMSFGALATTGLQNSSVPPGKPAGRALRTLVPIAFVALVTFGVAWGALRAARESAARPVDLAGMVFLPGATFTMGRSPEEIAKECVRLDTSCKRDTLEREQPERRVTLSPFYLDVHEVTNADFAAWLNVDPWRLNLKEDSETHEPRYVYMQANQRQLIDLYAGRLGVALDPSRHFSVRPGFERKPVVQVTWDAARLYCEARGKRLPTEAEWELAARGDTNRRYPWGDDDPRCDGVVLGRAEGLPCTALPAAPEDVAGAAQDWTPDRVAGMGGNVSEWVYDAFELPYYPPCGDCKDPRVDGHDAPDETRVFRGGAWASKNFARASARGRWKRSSLADSIGFRCAADAAR
jgi:formylglycine-generating enzyme required for sulfatase activity/tRNA A-37 threonylcarbamoyl transferase component Bud32